MQIRKYAKAAVNYAVTQAASVAVSRVIKSQIQPANAASDIAIGAASLVAGSMIADSVEEVTDSLVDGVADWYTNRKARSITTL